MPESSAAALLGEADIEAVADAVAETRAPINEAEFEGVGDFVATIRVDWSLIDLTVDVSSAIDSVLCVVEAGFLEGDAAVVGLAVVVLAVVVSSSLSSFVALEIGLVATAGGTRVFGGSAL